jgi:hypothetical protein
LFVSRFDLVRSPAAQIALVALALLPREALVLAANGVGTFENHRDIGAVGQPGSVEYDESSQTYTIAGGGANMWSTNDALHFTWVRVTGDFELSAAVKWLGTGGDPHRKACLLARQTLDADSAYVDVAIHGDGLSSLQFRHISGGVTREVQFARSIPVRVALARHGDTFYAKTSEAGEASKVAGAFMRIKLSDPIYVGLGVCAHDNNRIEKARFAEVNLTRKTQTTDVAARLHSALETVPIASGDRRVVFHTSDHIEAPNWSPDGSSLLYNSGGGIYKLSATGSPPARLDTGFAQRCNNDHGLSADGKWLAISDQSKTGKSLIYVVPASGGTPRTVTELGPSYWHGWSPDGSRLVYCAERGGEFDVYAISAEGGNEVRLTTAKGLDDGPEYSPDGKFIYFNSDRTGRMQIWRMKPDGSEQEQVTNDEFNNWFPHPSPDGKWIVILSYEADVSGHPENKPVGLRILPSAGGEPRELVRLFGGQGTINVPSWSPDSRQFAFVSYELLPENNQ